MPDKQCLVYWLHLEAMQDAASEGYIGITTQDARKRYDQHCKVAAKGSKYTVHKAVRKYGDKVIVTVLSAGSIQDCRDTELRMRPKPNMGWNFAAGGGGNPGLVHTQEARKKMSEANKAWLSVPGNKKCTPHTAVAKAKMSVAKAGKAPSDATKTAQKLYMSALHSWEKPASNASVWLLAGEFYDFCSAANGAVSDRKLSAQFGLGRSEVRTVLKKINGGWNPHIDAAWNDFRGSSKQSNSR